MGLDFGGPAIEVAIGLAFVFFLLSTIVSAITEGIAWLTKQRAAQLEKGILGLLGENKFAEDILKHALVQSDARKPKQKEWGFGKTKKKRPAYVSARNFSLALIDVLGKRGKEDKDELQNVRNGLADLNGNRCDDDNVKALRQQLEALLGDPAVKGLKDFRKSAEKWFDDGMDRVSGWYKRWAQMITCVFALVVAIGLNVNAIGVAEQLANEPTVRAAVVSGAEAAAAEGGSDAESVGKSASEAVDNLESLELALLWPDGFHVNLTMAIGWLITALAISLGAPFWFDALSKLSRLRTTGKKPAAGGEATG